MALAGEYALSVTLRGGHARGSPLRISLVASGVHAPRCIAEGTGLRAGFKDQRASFAIIARDAFGNRVSRGAHGYSVRVRPPLSATRAPEIVVADRGDGTCGCEWLPTARGRHVIQVTLGGMPIEGSDFICHVT
jgi:tripartite motif-containing protein 45